MKLFRKKTIVSVTRITGRGERTKRTELTLTDAKRHKYEIELGYNERIVVVVEL